MHLDTKRTKTEGKLNWLMKKYVSIGTYQIPCAKNLQKQANHNSGIRRNSKLELILKKLAWPLVKFRSNLLVDGFIERGVGRWIKEFTTKGSVCLEVGCGDMSLRKFLPKNIWYNGFDFSFSEFQLLRVLKKKEGRLNLAIASATDIPLESNSASVIFSKEVFEHIPEIDLAVDEIYRIAKPGAKLICSIPNNHCYKYKKKGAHPQHVNDWTYDEFIKYMQSHSFKLIEGYMIGLWIPLPRRLTNTSYQLPISSRNEYYNTNFLFLFEAKTPAG